MTTGETKCALGVLAPHVGAASETFITRHMAELAPGRTAVVAAAGVRNEKALPANTPLLDLTTAGERRLPQRALSRARRMLGAPSRSPQTLACERFLRRSGVRVVLAEYLDWAWRFRDLKARLGVRMFAHAHGYDVSLLLRDPVWRARYRDLAALDGVITMSEASASRLEALGLPHGKIHVVPYGVELPALRQKTAAPVEFVCLAVGRMVAKKAPILLLDAFRRAHQQNPGLRLHYAGGGALLSAARHYVQAAGLGDVVTLHGALEHAQILELMSIASAFVQHSVVDEDSGDEEGLPVAILEAMAHALPVVSTHHAGIPEEVDDGVSGMLVDEGDVRGMGAALVRLAGDPELSRAMGRAGRDRVRERFLWTTERARLLKILGMDA